jgi:hypothetical protein
MIMIILTFVAITGLSMWGGGMAVRETSLAPILVVAGTIGLIALGAVLTLIRFGLVI